MPVTNMTHLTNGALSDLQDLILGDDYNDELKNLLKHIHQVQFTEREKGDVDKNDDQKDLEQCDLIINRKWIY